MNFIPLKFFQRLIFAVLCLSICDILTLGAESIQCLQGVQNPPTIFLYGEVHDLSEMAKSFFGEEKALEIKSTLDSMTKQSRELDIELSKKNFKREIVYAHEKYDFNPAMPESLLKPAFEDQAKETSTFGLEVDVLSSYTGAVLLYSSLWNLQNLWNQAVTENDKIDILKKTITLALLRFNILDDGQFMKIYRGRSENVQDLITESQKFRESQNSTDFKEALQEFKQHGLAKILERLRATLDHLTQEIIRLKLRSTPKDLETTMTSFLKNPEDRTASKKVSGDIIIAWRNQEMFERVKTLFCEIAVPNRVDLHIMVGRAHLDGLKFDINKWSKPFGRKPKFRVVVKDLVSVPSGSTSNVEAKP